MSDFDKFFNERLDEEGQFPNKNKNWRGLSKRLDALDMGAQVHRPRLRIWQAATTIAVAGCVFLVYHSVQMNKELRALRKEVAELSELLKSAPSMMAQTESSQNAHPSVDPGEYRIPVKSTEESSVPAEVNPIDKNEKKETLKVAGLPDTDFRKELAKHKLVESKSPKTLPENPVPPGSPDLPSAAPPSTDAVANIPPVSANNPDNPVNTPPVAAATSEPADSLTGKTADPSVETTSAPPAPEQTQAKPTEAAPPIIKPAFRNLGLKVGPYAVIGWAQPKQQGVSALMGQGISAQYKVWRGFWLEASAEWLHYDVGSVEFPEKFYPPHDTFPKPNSGWGGWNHHHKLIMVESSLKQQQYGLGARYEIPFHRWLQPFVKVSHNWVHQSSALVTYTYEEIFWNPHHQFPPHIDYSAEKIEGSWLNQQWHFGIGVEKNIPRWTFGVYADYSKSFAANTPDFDVLYLKAGVQYKM